MQGGGGLGWPRALVGRGISGQPRADGRLGRLWPALLRGVGEGGSCSGQPKAMNIFKKQEKRLKELNKRENSDLGWCMEV